MLLINSEKGRQQKYHFRYHLVVGFTIVDLHSRKGVQRHSDQLKLIYFPVCQHRRLLRRSSCRQVTLVQRDLVALSVALFVVLLGDGFLQRTDSLDAVLWVRVNRH